MRTQIRGRHGVLRKGEWRFNLAPLAQAVALALAAGTLTAPAYAQRAFSPAWFADKGAIQNTAVQTGRLSNGMPASSLTSPLGQQQRANDQLKRSINNLNLAARGIAAQQAAQEAARRAAGLAPSDVPDGLAEGGLKVDTNSLTAGWLNAKDPTQTVANGHTTVGIQQTADKAILNWETFNVGRNTTVDFKQNADWAVLNRVNDPNARPSQILGQIKGDGTVLVVNRNGVVFDGTSQVNTRNLVAAAANISNTQFQSNGIYGADANTASLTDALGKVEVKAGARITTHEPKSVKQGGGYVLLAGSEVHNAGEITTRKGQTQLAAGDSFLIRKGVGTDANTASTTRGNEIAPQFVADSTAGKVSNSGLILSREGDITLAGRDVRQDGVAISTTTVNTRGTVHLLNSAADTLGKVTLGKDAITAVVLEDDGKTTALDSQRDALIAESAKQDLLRSQGVTDGFNNLSAMSDRRDLSRIEIVSGGNVVFEGDSLTLATGGQIVSDARGRSFVADKAQLDVAGAVGVTVAMESNNVKVNVQGNELRDSPLNRDSRKLFNNDVWMDRRQLVLVPKGTGGYESDRWYTSNGLLEVGGYLSNQGHGIGEWAAQGGTVLLGGNEVITQAGSSVNLAGGTLDVQTGFIHQTWLKGSDGRLYSLDKAPADMVFNGVYKGFESDHERWKVTEFFYNPLIGPQKRLENGYTVGRDAGTLIVSAPTAVLEGDIVADVFNGARQSRGRDALDDGYRQAQTAVARAGSLSLGRYSANEQHSGRTGAFDSDVRIGDIEPVTLDLSAVDLLPENRIGTVWLDAKRLNEQHLGGLSLATASPLSIDAPLVLADGGSLSLTAPVVDFNANVTARGGSVRATNRFVDDGVGNVLFKDGWAAITVAEGVTLDLRGLWVNSLLDSQTVNGLAHLDGGSVWLSSTGDVTLAERSLIDVSSGGAMLANRTTRGGRGGSVTLHASEPGGEAGSAGTLTLNGDIRGYGVRGGGTLSLQTGGAWVLGGRVLQTDGELAAGEVSKLDLVLDKPLQLQAGDITPIDVHLTRTRFKPNETIDGYVQWEETGLDVNFRVGEAGWKLPLGMVVYVGSSRDLYSSWNGDVVPPGATVVGIGEYSSLEGGYFIDPASLPDGIPLPVPIHYTIAAGHALREAVTLPAGRVLPAGTVLDQAVAVRPLIQNFERFLDQGFSRYEINAQRGLIVTGDTVLAPVVPTWQFTEAARTAASGAHEQALALTLAPLFVDDPLKASLTQRPGADLVLRSGQGGGSSLGGGFYVGENVRIGVDPGREVLLASGGQVTVEGHIEAPGGRITIVNQQRHTNDGPGALSVWIGAGAVLDASGRAYVANDARGKRYGLVHDGGTIVLGSLGGKDAETGNALSSDAFVIVRPGAVLDVSGASAVLDAGTTGGIAGQVPTATIARTVASDGGEIAMRSYSGIYNEGNLRAAAGAAGASGGNLVIELESPIYRYSSSPQTVPAHLRAGRVLTVGQSGVPTALPDSIKAGELSESLVVGHAGVSAEQLQAGGFDSATLWARDAIAFDGSVSLTLGRSLTLGQGQLVNTVAGAQAALSAPYVLLDGRTTIRTNLYEMVPDLLPDYADGTSLRIDAGLIDVRNRATAGLSHLTLASAGDVRLLASTDEPTNGVATTILANTGNLTVNARRIYPASGVLAKVYVGAALRPQSADEAAWVTQSTLKLGRLDDAQVSAPYSVFGDITLAAERIVQGGNLLAPLGSITLQGGGRLATSADYTTNRVELLNGSVTSVSAAGLVMPYGGTTDGVRYMVDGDVVVGTKLVTGELNDRMGSAVTGININATNIVSHEGSLLDVSGGGTLLGAGFVTGRGGSVDALLHPRQTGGQVFALVPGIVTAPVAGGYFAPWTGDVPGIGEQITIPAGVPGLAAGTYTLLPANYSLMPGAFRVELGAQSLTESAGVAATRDGSFVFSGVKSISGTGIRDALASTVTLTPGDVVRSWSHFNETSYADSLLAQAATQGAVRPMLERDGRFLNLFLRQLPVNSGATDDPALVFEGRAAFGAAKDGYDGTLTLQGASYNEITGGAIGGMVITGPGGSTTRTNALTPVSAATLNAIGASTLYIGGAPTLNDVNVADSVVALRTRFNGFDSITLTQGAVLEGAQIFLSANAITLESGAGLSTLGWAATAPDSSLGYQFSNRGLLVSSGWIDLASANLNSNNTVAIRDGAFLYAEGTIGATAGGAVEIEGTPRLGARYLALSSSAFNIGDAQSLAAAQAAGVLPAGLGLNQSVIDKLLLGDAERKAPATERLTLTAADSINFLGSVELSTYDPVSGTSLLDQFVIQAPAIYGYGAAHDAVRLETDTLVWGGNLRRTSGGASASASPGGLIAGGPGSGLGTFDVQARQIVMGYPDIAQPNGQVDFNRLALGFSSVNLAASERIVSNNRGNLAVYQSGPSPDALYDAAAYAGVGGALNLVTPLLTGTAGSVMTYRTGGALRVTAPENAVATTHAAALGASVNLVGGSINVNTAVVLPSGKLTLTADQDIVLGDGAQVDLSGRAIDFFDVTKHSWGGELVAQSAHGDIRMAQGASIDVSAEQADAGRLQFTATDAAAGKVRLDGSLLGRGGEGFSGGSLDVRAQLIGADVGSLTADFAALNNRLSKAGFTEGRSFVLKQGSLAIGDELRAHEVTVSIDGGSLNVNGRIDASGAAPGTIRLAARDDLTLSSAAVLDAHGTKLQVDGYGQAVEAKNRGKVELTSRDGWVRLAPGAAMDLSAPDGVARGRVELNVGRTAETSGDMRIDARGPLTINGVGSLALNGFWRYSPTDGAGTIVQNNGGTTPVATDGSVGLDQIDVRSVQFIDAALANTDLSARTAGLSAYGAIYHLRPGVEINSEGTSTGQLTVKGDLDLSKYRYGPNAGRDPHSSSYGAGEPLTLVVRAADGLTIKGSITDGFGLPAATADDNGWRSALPSDTLTSPYTLSAEAVITAATIPTTAAAPFDLQLATFRIKPNVIVPLGFVLTITFSYPRYPWVTTAPIYRRNGTLLYETGATVTGDIPTYSYYSPGTVLPAQGINARIGYLVNQVVVNQPIPAGTSLGFINTAMVSFSGNVAVAPGTVIPAGTTLTGYFPSRSTGSDGVQGRIYAVAPMLAPRSLSASLRLVSGADLAAADMRTRSGDGSMLLEDAHVSASTSLPLPSVIRTGTGDLELLSGGDLRQSSLFGVYTAGTQLEAGDQYASLVAKSGYFTDGGGDLRVETVGTLSGYVYQNITQNRWNQSSYSVGNWLVRQGDADNLAAWGIRFGAYNGNDLSAFTGFGTLGGGNLAVRVDKDAGLLEPVRPYPSVFNTYVSSGLVFAVGGSGWVTQVNKTAEGAVTGGTLEQRGGGELDVLIGGRLNPGATVPNSDSYGHSDFNGSFTNVRGDISVQAGAIGAVPLVYGNRPLNDPRAAEGYRAPTLALRGGTGAPVVVIGDGVADLRAQGDIVLGGVGDPGRILNARTGPAFSLWQPGSAIQLFSAGGNLIPYNVQPANGLNIGGNGDTLPPAFQAIAAQGSLYWAGERKFTLVPSARGFLELLAGDSIYASAFATGANSAELRPSGGWSVSGAKADPNSVWNPFRPGNNPEYFVSADTVLTNLHAGDEKTIRIYAVAGDIVNLILGDPTPQYTDEGYVPRYSAAMPARILAGRDIVNFGTGAYRGDNGQESSPSLILNNDVTDVSIIRAGRDIWYANVQVAGPGSLEVTAGGNVFQGDKASILSIGPIVEGDTRPGASIVVQAGVGPNGPDFSALSARYLSPANLADPALPLADQVGKVAKTYEAELVAWLTERYGFAGTTAEALGYFSALAPEQQRIFLRSVYYAELREGGREYNDVDGKRFGSYLRGRQMIAALFPDQDAAGKVIERRGDITMFGGSGVRTLFGGDIQMLAPGGQIVVGLQGEIPPSTSGIVTQGDGDIQLFSEGSLLLGLSRVMTTFGGDILAWSAKGDINAGRGSKTTLVYTPPKRVYDAYGNVTLSPDVPSTGAGIATLNPLPEVPPGDIDLIAPLGTIDAGEAGIRFSGNINVAALHVVNADNIKGQGEATGIPTVAAVNVAALTNASAAASQAAGAAQEVLQRDRAAARQNLPSVFTVRVLGFGNEPMGDVPSPSAPSRPDSRTELRYDKSSVVQVVGEKGRLYPEQAGYLTEGQRQRLRADR